MGEKKEQPFKVLLASSIAYQNIFKQMDNNLKQPMPS
jgi:hypothetical protein